MPRRTPSMIATHASIIRGALLIAGVHAHVRTERDRIDVLIPSGDHTEIVAATVIAEVRRGPFALLVAGEA